MTTIADPLSRRDLAVAELDVARANLIGSDPREALERLERLQAEFGPGPLDELEEGFDLSAFERQTLLLACGPDLVGEVARELTEHGGQPRLSFATALARLPGAHWDAITPQGPLRHWGMVRLAEPDAVLASPLVADERIVHYLVGTGDLDERLELLSRPLAVPTALPPTLGQLAAEVVARWAGGVPVRLRGPQLANLHAVAAAACAMLRLEPRLLGAGDLPVGAGELTPLLRRLVRETVIGRVGWVVDLDDGPVTATAGLGRALRSGGAPIVLIEPSGPGAAPARGWDLPLLQVPRLEVGERRQALDEALRRVGTVSAEELDAVVGAFDLPVPDLDVVAAEVASGVPLWDACRRRHRPDVGPLAQLRIPRAGWDDLVLPDAQLAQLRALTAAVRHRSTVLDEWGFARRSSRGLGTVALFAGGSGTGKTFAAEVIAHDLELDLVHVDLSQVVDKYLGETEKRLAALFDAAEDGGMVLLFDEADTLFGKRTEVKDSHDRYANVEVGYLLQRLESFVGLAILTTNSRSSLDQAFTRRLSAIVNFPYPDRDARRRVWAQCLPEAMPRDGIDLARLAETDLPGGGIAAASLQAAYLAAEAGGVLTMEHLRQAVTWELAKSGRVAASPRREPPGNRRGGDER